MKRVLLAAVLGVGVCVSAPASAQILADGPIVYGHHHLRVSNLEATKKFFVDGLGGTVIRIGENRAEVIQFPNVLIFMQAQAPTGGTKGTSVDHIGFGVPDLRKAVERIKGAGFRMVTSSEAGPPRVVKDDIAYAAPGTTGASIAFAMGPDDVKVELVETPQQTAPIALNHVHFYGQQNNDMQAWYVKVFDAMARQGANFPSAVLPGVSLNFSASPTPVIGTAGRTLDHIGFEVRNLEDFVKKLESQGVKLNVAYRQVPTLNISLAFITDPWGTYIELTEGLGRVALARDGK
jgi:catechol 2,3-dioxygenase-like lactoylglutathione lyase family enzyme